MKSFACLITTLLVLPSYGILNHYLRIPKTDAIGNDIEIYECGEGSHTIFDCFHKCSNKSLFFSGFSEPCDIDVLAARCNANPRCNGFNSNGFLKSCTGGCDLGCCYDVTDHVDLYIRQGYLPPEDWQEKIDHGRLLYANPEPHYCFLPEIANGYLGTAATSASLFQNGLFNGHVICF